MDIQSLARRLEGYDPLDVLATFGALQLIPQNAERTLRFETLSQAAAVLTKPQKPKPFLSTKIKQICNDIGATDRHAEDPAENLFTDVVSYYGGDYLILPGIAENPAHNLQVMARALTAPSRPYRTTEFPTLMTGLIMGVLRLSDAIARRAGLRRYMPVPDGNRKVVVPSDGELTQLKTAVIWSQEEIEALLVGLPAWILDGLIQSVPPPRDGAYDHDRNPLHERPIIHRGDSFVIPAPNLLAWATLNRIIGYATSAGEVDTLRDNTVDAAWRFTEETCRMLGFTQLQNELNPRLEIEAAREGFFRFDVDKVAYVLLVSDHLADYDPSEPAAFVPDDRRPSAIDERIQKALNHAYEHQEQANSVLVILVLQGFTRGVGVNVSRVDVAGEPAMLWMPSADLRTIAVLELGNTLHLWKYARAARAARKSMQVVVVNPLDEYGFYRSQDYSYYVTDEARPNVLTISTGYIQELRREALHKIDRHSVPAPERGLLAEVVALQPGIPIYFTTRDLGKPIRHYVEGPFPAWIIPQAETDAEEAPLLHMLGDALAYWIWQMQGHLATLFPALAVRATQEPLFVRIRASASEAWQSFEGTQENALPLTLSYDADRFELAIEFHPASANTFHGPENNGERQLLRSLLHTLRTHTDEGQPSDEQLAAVIESVAPLGPKKKILVFATGESQMGQTVGLPQSRTLDKSEQQRVLDDLGAYLANRHTVGRLSRDRATALVHDAVDWLFQRLAALVRQLRPEGFMRAILAYDEALLARQTFMETTIAAQLACYGDTPAMRDGLVEQTHKLHGTAVAHRFLIEYVAAQPPSGLRPFSLSVLDELLALCEKIVTFGFDGDLLYFELAPAEFGMLPSGRLGRSTEFDEARNAYLRVLTAQALEAQSRRFERYWGSTPPTVATPPPELDTIDHVCSAEFGLSLTQLRDIYASLVDLTIEEENGIAQRRVRELEDHLRTSCALSEAEARTAIELLSLKPRQRFEEVTPFKKREVYPWKFNRALSYLRRPIIIFKENAGHDSWALWSRRHTFRASQYLGGLIFEGRLQPTSGLMKEWLGRQAHLRGAEFEAVTVEMLKGKGYVVKASVKKIHTPRGTIRPPGDIDALVIDPKRRIVFPVECKDISIARTPSEVANELDRLTKDVPGHRSVMAKHLARAEWVNDHLAEVLEWAIGASPEGWKVKPRLITDEPLFAPSLRKMPIPVLAFDQVERKGLR